MTYQELVLLSGDLPLNWGSLRIAKGSNCEDSIQDNGWKSKRGKHQTPHAYVIPDGDKKNFFKGNWKEPTWPQKAKVGGKDQKWRLEQGNKAKWREPLWREWKVKQTRGKKIQNAPKRCFLLKIFSCSSIVALSPHVEILWL